MQLTKEEVQKIAELARIDLTEDEIDKRQKDLSNVLVYFDKLSELNTENVEEIGNMTGMTNIYRNDFVDEATDEEKKGIMENLSEVQFDYIKVKSIL